MGCDRREIHRRFGEQELEGELRWACSYKSTCKEIDWG